MNIADIPWSSRTCCGTYRHAVVGSYKIQETEKGYVVTRQVEGLLDRTFGDNGILRRVSEQTLSSLLSEV